MKFLCSILLLFFICSHAIAQGKFILKDDAKSYKVKFKLINNLIVFPVEINGVKLSFLLDTGVSKPILFNTLQGIDTLQINDVEKIFLRGLGDGEVVEAIKSRKNIVKIGEALNVNQTLFVVFDNSLDFAPRLGLPVHGIIGYDLFRDFVVEINYTRRYFKLHDPKTYVVKPCKKCEIFDLDFYNSKPYIEAEINNDDKTIPVKLLIDSGGSDALWLFEDTSKQIHIPENNFEDFLGNGLSGSVFGKRSKVEKLYLKSFVFSDVNVAFPDSTAIFHARKFEERNGSIAGELLKRFNIVYDYQNNKIELSKNGFFNRPFNYNKSGISLEYGDVRLIKEKENRSVENYSFQNDTQGAIPVILVTTFKYSFKSAFSIVQLRKGSPAERAGLQLNDVILKINGKESYEFSLQEMLHHFYDRDGKKIRLKIDRNGKSMVFTFKLENLLNKKTSQN